MGTIVKEYTADTAERTDALLTGGSLERLGAGSRRACYRLPGTGLRVKCYRNDVEAEEGRRPGKSPVPNLRSAIPAITRLEVRRCFARHVQTYGVGMGGDNE